MKSPDYQRLGENFSMQLADEKPYIVLTNNFNDMMALSMYTISCLYQDVYYNTRMKFPDFSLMSKYFYE